MSDLTIGTVHAAMQSGEISGDQQEWADVENKLAELLPGVDTGDLTDAVREQIKANPNATPAEVLEAVVKELNPEVGSAEVSALRSEWEQFAQSTGMEPSELLEIMKTPETGSEVTATSIKDMMADLMAMMIQLFGEEAASQLLEGFAERDTVMALAKQKASEMRTMAWCQLGLGLCSAATSIVGGIGGMRMAGNAAKSQAFSTMMGGGAKVFDSLSQMSTSLIQANIAELDGESQSAQMRKETAQKLEDMARDLIKVMIDIYNSMMSQEYQTMSKLSNV